MKQTLELNRNYLRYGPTVPSTILESETYYPILRTLQCCGLLFKIVGEELVHYNLICLQISSWNASELRGAYIQRFTEVVL